MDARLILRAVLAAVLALPWIPALAAPCDDPGSPLCAILEAEKPRPGAPADRFLPPRFDDTAVLTPLLASVPRPPQPLRTTDGRFHLVYELQLANYGSFPAARPPRPIPPAALEVTEVAVFADGGSTPLVTLAGAALQSRMQLAQLGISDPTVTLVRGQRGTVFLDLLFSDRRSIPRQLVHRVTVKAVAGTGDQPVIDETVHGVAVDPTPVVVLGPLVRGGVWVNFNGCCDFATPHRRIGRGVNGREFWPERFAVDLIKAVPVSGQLHLFRSTGDEVEDWFATGEDILAAADGVVTRVVTDLPNNAIDDSPFPPAIASGGGNEVLVHLGDGIFTMYGHLLPGTVRVRVGDRVRRGDVLGKLGNTGQSSAPHLHFQVMDDNSIAASEGLPWVLDRFVLVGSFESVAADGSLAGVSIVDAVRRGELPLQQSLIRFP
jgi:hypothetical protein